MVEEIKYIPIDRDALEGPALSYAVSLVLFPEWGNQFRIWTVLPELSPTPNVTFLPHISWKDAGDLIQKYSIMMEPSLAENGEWAAHVCVGDDFGGHWEVRCHLSPKAAACKAFLAAKMPKGVIPIPKQVADKSLPPEFAVAEEPPKQEAPGNPLEQRIVCAAVRCRQTGRVIPSVRHCDKFVRAAFPSEEALAEFDDEQGFLDNRYVFLTRTEAWRVALLAGQIIRRCGGDHRDGGTLYSENLY